MTDFFRGKIALVTGATRGLGRAAALAFARAGAHIVALGRKAEDLEALDDDIRSGGAEATLVPLDMRDFSGIDKLGPTLLSHWGRLDILVLNAGTIGPMMPLEQIPPAAMAETIETNFIGNWRLFRALQPLLTRAKAARVIGVTSGVVRTARAYLGAYAASKAALEMLIKTYAEECAETNIRANLLNPGPARTEMRARFMPGEDPFSLPTPEDIAPLFLALAAPELVLNGALIDFRDWREGKSALAP